MAKFVVQSHNNQKAVLVDPSNYKHTLLIDTKPTTSRHGQSTVDNFRQSITVRNAYGVKSGASCLEKACSIAREESITASFVVAAGQDAAYYVAKQASLTEMINILTTAKNAIQKLAVGGEIGVDFDVVPAA